MRQLVFSIFFLASSFLWAQDSCTPSPLQQQTANFQKLCAKIRKASCSSPDNEIVLNTISLENSEPLSENVVWKKYGETFDSFEGVNAYSNKSGTGGGKYQCTELVHRFMHDVYGVPTKIGIGLGDGDQLAKNMVARFRDVTLENASTQNKKAHLAYIENGCSGNAPAVGSILSIKYSQWGHVGIVRDIKQIDDTHLQITLFEQHGVMHLKAGETTHRTQLIFTKGADGAWTGPQVVGWANVVEN